MFAKNVLRKNTPLILKASPAAAGFDYFQRLTYRNHDGKGIHVHERKQRKVFLRRTSFANTPIIEQFVIFARISTRTL